MQKMLQMLQIVWRQKHKNEHGTWDKKNLTPPPIRICPLFDELKKGDFFTPLPPIWTNVSFSAIFFLNASLRAVISPFKWMIRKLILVFSCPHILTYIEFCENI